MLEFIIIGMENFARDQIQNGMRSTELLKKQKMKLNFPFFKIFILMSGVLCYNSHMINITQPYQTRSHLQVYLKENKLPYYKFSAHTVIDIATGEDLSSEYSFLKFAEDGTCYHFEHSIVE